MSGQLGLGRHPASSPTLFGRVDELASVRNAVASVAAGLGGVVVVEGEAGIGKTALIRSGLTGAGRADVKVFSATAEQMDGHRPYGVVLDALGVSAGSNEPGRTAIAALLSPTGHDDSPLEGTGIAFRVEEALLDLVDEACSACPVALVLEDLHWADAASMTVLQRLSRRLAQLRLLLVLSTRPLTRHSELIELLASTRGAERIVHLPLGPLPEPSWAPLVESLLGKRPGSAVLGEVARAGGNPLFITELIGALDREGIIGVASDGTAMLSAKAPSASLALTILRHLRFLSPCTRDLLGLASVLGARFSVSDLASVAERSVVALRSSLVEALEAGVLGEEGERLAFRHELIRDTLYEDLPLALRRGLHADVATKLAASGAAPTRVARHLLLAGARDAETVRWLHRAATEAQWGSPRIAVDLWERAMEMAGDDDPLRPEMQVGMALALTDAGRPVEAEALCRRILAVEASGMSEGRLRFFLSRSLMLRGRLEEAEVAASCEGLPPTDSARLRGSRAALTAFRGDLGAAESAARIADDEASDAGDTAGRVIALSALGFVLGCRGELRQAAEVLTTAVDLGEADGTRTAHEAAPRVQLALVLGDLDRTEDATTMIARGSIGASAESLTWQWKAQIIGLALMLTSARFDDAFAELEAMSTLSEETGICWQGLVLAARAQIALYRNGPAEAETWLRSLDTIPGPTAPGIGMSWIPRARATQLAAVGDPASGFALAWEAWEAFQAAGLRRECATLGFDLVGLAALVGDRVRAEEVAQELATLAEKNQGVASLRGAAQRALGLVSDDADLLLAALGSYRASPRRYEHARAAEDAALCLARAGRGPEAEATAGEALDLYSEVGATWEASRARAAMRCAGMHPGSRATRCRSRTGWESLTTTEIKVVALVARGLSNPEMAARLYISRRTVESHVSHILAKLALHSRTELAVAAAHRPRP